MLIILLISCNSTDNVSSPTGNMKITPRSTAVTTVPFRIDGLLFPDSTVLTSYSGGLIQIQLPYKYYFVVVNVNGTLAFEVTKCYWCHCDSQSGPTASNGCQPALGTSGFGCDHLETQCTTCTGEYIKCTNHASSFIAGIVNMNESFRFVSDTNDFKNLSDWRLSDTAVIHHLFDTLQFSTSKSVLFDASYATLNQPENHQIVISAYGNKTVLSVKADWEDHMKVEGYAIPEVDPQNLWCDCARGGNPFDIISGTCTLGPGWPAYYALCVSRCNNGCIMGLKTNQ